MFDIDFKRLMALLLPTFLRKPILFGLLRAAAYPLENVYGRFDTARSEHLFRLTHNGQVCYLRACLNAIFGNGFEIGSVERDGKWLYAITESGEHIPLAVDEDNDSDTDNAPVLSSESSLNAAQNDFVVFVPANIPESSKPAIEALVNKYKLITKRATYYWRSA